MKKLSLVLIAVLAGLMLAAGWPARGFPGLLFIGMVPFLFLENHIASNKPKFIKFSVLFYSYPGFLAWNILTTWWICNSTLVGAILAIVLNSMFMSIVLSLYHYSKNQLKSRAAGYACLVFYWMALEYLVLNWDLNWPWLNLGNGFSSGYKWVEWYEYTGTFGGTLWVLISNILFFEILRQFLAKPRTGKVEDTPLEKVQDRKQSLLKTLRMPVLWVLWITVPLVISLAIYRNYKEVRNPVNVVIVQPNLDPYKEQYNIPPSEVLMRVLNLAAPELDSNVNFLVAPESAIQEEMWENDLNTFRSIHLLRNLISKYPRLNILIGGSTFRIYGKGETPAGSARTFTDTNMYYDAYNTAILLNSSDSLQLYHKSKLTPGVESLPSFGRFKFLEKFAINLGGTVGTLGKDRVRKVFGTVGTVKASPAICYESIFGEFFAEFVRNGAEVMFIITNDGWWGNTGGYRQHFTFASLRAIETRRDIARSANTGISAIIDQRGDPHQETAYWVPAVIRGTVNANSAITFYVRHGDWLARIATVIGGAFLLASLLVNIQNRRTLN
jgi:apolipoprotein N-acyltransferase